MNATDIAALCVRLEREHNLRPGGGSHVAYERTFDCHDSPAAIESELAKVFASLTGRATTWIAVAGQGQDVIVRIRTRRPQ